METHVDELSFALRQMQDNLKKVAEEHTERIWLQAGRNSLNEKLRGDRSLQEVSKNIIDQLAAFSDAQIGAFYVLEEGMLHFQYAYGIKEPVRTSFHPGEGLVGQAAETGRLTVFNDIPPQYFLIESSLGQEKPQAILILPAMFENKTVAVIELAKFGAFHSQQLKLLEEIAEPVGIAIQSILAKRRLEKLVSQLDGKEKELNTRITAINRSNAAIEFDLDGKILRANELFLDLLGYREEEVIGRHHSIFVEEGYASTKEYREFWRRLKKGEFMGGEFKRVAKNGELVWLQGNYNPLLDRAGKPAGVLKIATDITPVKKQQMEIDAITNAIFRSNLAVEFDLNGIILKANQNFLDLLGYTAAEITGRHHSLLVEKGYETTSEYEAFWKALRSGEYQQGEYKRVTRNGELVWIRGNYNPILDAQGRPYKILKIATDVTLARQQAQELATLAEELEAQQEELRQINEEMKEKNLLLESSQAELKAQQEELQQTNEELEEKANLLEIQKEELETAKTAVEVKAGELETTGRYKSEFLANMSHELRTPLNSILILAQLLMENKSKVLGEKEVEYASNIRSSGTDLLNLINEILDLSKVEAGKMEMEVADISIAELTARLKSMFSEVAKDRGVHFGIHTGKEISGRTLSTDTQRLEQILKNLLSNAFKFTHRDGRVGLDIDIVPANDNVKHPGLRQQAQVISFSVKDTGIGIPGQKLEIIFEAFQQADGSTKRKYGGTGLGLSISRELAGALGGEIHVQSEEGKGSTFTLYLPLVFDPGLVSRTGKGMVLMPAANKKMEEPAGAVHIATPKEDVADDRFSILEKDKVVLIIEDDPDFARILLDFARQRQCKGIVALQGNAGLSLARHYHPDAILLDMKLPVMDGADVLKQLKSDPNIRHIPVQIFSGYDRRREGLMLGAFDFIRKPVSADDLRTVFERLDSYRDRKLKKLLIVEDNRQQNKAIRELIGNGDVKTLSAYTGEEAYEIIGTENFDCIIIDLGLPDMSGFDLLEKIRKGRGQLHTPIIVYTGRDLSREETQRLNKLASTVVLKTADSRERLLDETTLFLHRVESNLPKDKQQMIRKLHRSDEVLKNKKVLIVDDDMRNIYSLTNALEEEGMICITAENGKTAVRTFKDTSDVDIILMDVMMPEMDGYEAAREIRKTARGAKMPVIALTAKAMKGDREKCLDAGMSDYIAKPVDIDKLLSLMRIWLYR